LCLRHPNALQQFRRGFIFQVLFHEPSPDGEVENEPAQACDGVGGFDEAVEVLEEAVGGHRRSASARMALSWSCSASVCFSVSSSLASSFTGSPWSSATVWGFLMSRL